MPISNDTSFGKLSTTCLQRRQFRHRHYSSCGDIEHGKVVHGGVYIPVVYSTSPAPVVTQLNPWVTWRGILPPPQSPLRFVTQRFASREEFSSFFPRRARVELCRVQTRCAFRKPIFAQEKRPDSVGLELAESALLGSYEVKPL